MDLSRYEVEISYHAFKQAMARGIHPDLIENTLLTGKVERFGKHGVKFVSEGDRTIICVGQIVGMNLKIFTVEAIWNHARLVKG